MSTINLQNIRQAEGLLEELQDARKSIESKLSLKKYLNNKKSVNISGNKIMRICLLAGLSSKEKRQLELVEQVQLSKNSNRIFETLFTLHNLSTALFCLVENQVQRP